VGQPSQGVSAKSDDAVSSVLDHMRRFDLKGFVVWDFRNNHGHTHRFVHEGIWRTATFVAGFSKEPMHVCWVDPEDFRGASLTVTYNYSQANRLGVSRGRLGSSLVFASPKHMAWSSDPGLNQLPDDPTSKFVFHDFVPERFQELRHRGDALRWVAWGPDGNYPMLDSVNFVTQQRMPWTADSSRLPGLDRVACQGPTCMEASLRLYIAPWATQLLPPEILAKATGPLPRGTRSSSNSSRPALRFVGSLWDANAEEFVDFVEGCSKATVLWSGIKHDSPLMRQLEGSNNFAMAGAVDSEGLWHLLDGQEPFMPALQGSQHLSGNFSYVPDRALTLAASGRILGTNNPAVLKFFGRYSDAIVYRARASELCDAYADALSDASARAEGVRSLMEHIAKEHTYVSRLRDLLLLFGATSR